MKTKSTRQVLPAMETRAARRIAHSLIGKLVEDGLEVARGYLGLMLRGSHGGSIRHADAILALAEFRFFADLFRAMESEDADAIARGLEWLIEQDRSLACDAVAHIGTELKR